MKEQIPPLLEVVDHYRNAGVLQTVDGREPISAVSDAHARGRSARPATGPASTDGHPQVAPRDRQDAPGRPDRGRGPRPRRVGAQAGRHDRPPRSARRAPHPGGRRGARRSRATATGATRSRPACASRSTTRSSTASPAIASIREGQIVSIDAGAIFDGWHGDGARTFVVGEPSTRGPVARRGDPPGDDGRDRGGRAGRPSRRHLGRDRGRRRAARLRDRPPVRRPRHRHRDAPGAAGPELPDGRPRA